jgi:hypothetical protein
LVALGLKDNLTENLKNSLKAADGNVSKFASGFAKQFALAGIAVAAMTATAALGLAKFTGSLVKADGELEAFARNMGVSKDEAYKTKSALDVMGKSLEEVKLNPALLKQFEELKANAASLGIPDMSEGLKSVRDIGTAVLALKQTAANALQWVGFNFLKYVKQPMEDAKKLLNGYNETIKKNIPAWSDKVGKALSWVVQLGTTVIRGAAEIFKAIGRVFDMIPGKIKLVMGAFALLGAFIKAGPIGKLIMVISAVLLLLDDFFTYLDGGESLLGPVWKVLIDIFDKLKEGGEKLVAFFKKDILPSLVGAWEYIKNKAVEIWNGLKLFWKEHGEKVLSTLSAVWGAIQSVLIFWWNLITGIAQKFFGELETFWDTWGKDILTFFGETFDNILDVIRGVADFISGVFSGDWSKAWDGIKTIFGGVWDLLVNIVRTSVDIWMVIFDALGGFFKGLWEGIVSFFTGVWDTITSAVQSFVDFFNGVFDGVKNFFTGLWDSLSGVVKAFVDKILGFFKPVADFFSGIGDKIASIFGGKKTLKVEVDASEVSGAGHSEGGVFDKEHIARFAENGEAEAVIPLTKPQRAAEVMREAADFMGGAASTPTAEAAGKVEAKSAPIDKVIEKLSAVMATVTAAMQKLAAAFESFGGTDKSNGGGFDLSAIADKMSAFLDNANRIMAQMGQTTQSSAAYSAVSNSNVNYNSTQIDNKQNYTINDTSGNPRTTADMVSRTQAPHNRNLKGVFA